MIQYEVLTDLIDIKTSDNKTLLHDLTDMFLKQTPLRMHELNLAVEEKNKNQLTLLAHTLKASCSYLGLAEMTAICVELEELGMSELPLNINTTRVWMSALEESFEESSGELTKYISEVFH